MKSIQLTPIEIVGKLDKYIIGQLEAKKKVAIALRNKWRKQQIKTDIKQEIRPKNIILIGPTGTGKTEIARRLASLTDSPFIKVEATKFTEVGYVGRDVESMIRDLLSISIKICMEKAMLNVMSSAKKKSEEYILDLLLPQNIQAQKEENIKNKDISYTRDKLRTMLKSNMLDNKIVNIEVQTNLSSKLYTDMNNNEFNSAINTLQDILQNTFKYLKSSKKKQLTVREALKIVAEHEAYKLIDKNEINKQAVLYTEENGIIFIDEIDKIIANQYKNGTDISREGVQRDLLPIVEGTIVYTKFGPINTQNILFITAGAFHANSPSDLIPELQGRFPIKVLLNNLTEDDFVKILFEPENSLIKQYQALLSSDNIYLNFEICGIREIAKIALYMNTEIENIGARRLYLLIESLIEHESFHAPYEKYKKKDIVIDKKYVKSILKHFIVNHAIHNSIL